MGGLWVDYELMSNIPGLFVLGEANFSDHGANRLGASALMQGLADGYFVLPYTIANFFVSTKPTLVDTDHEEFEKTEMEVKDKIKRLLSIKGNKPAEYYHREVGLMMMEYCGMARNDAGLKKCLQEIPAIRDEFWKKRQRYRRE